MRENLNETALTTSFIEDSFAKAIDLTARVMLAIRFDKAQH